MKTISLDKMLRIMTVCCIFFALFGRLIYEHGQNAAFHFICGFAQIAQLFTYVLRIQDDWINFIKYLPIPPQFGAFAFFILGFSLGIVFVVFSVFGIIKLCYNLLFK